MARGATAGLAAMPARVLAWVVALALAGPAGAVTVEDDLGRAVTLRTPPERIAALAPHAVELLFYLGAGARIVATVAHADHPPAARAIERVGDAFALSLEALVARHPELVVAWASALGGERLARLEDLGLTVYVSEPRGLDGVLENLRELERLLGGGGASERFARALARLEPAPGSPRVAFLLGYAPLLVASDSHFLGDVVRRCGARNAFAGLAGGVARISAEALLGSAPDRVAYPAIEPTRRWRSRLAALGLADRALAVPADLVARPGPRLLAGARHLCKALGSGA